MKGTYEVTLDVSILKTYRVRAADEHQALEIARARYEAWRESEAAQLLCAEAYPTEFTCERVR